MSIYGTKTDYNRNIAQIKEGYQSKTKTPRYFPGNIGRGAFMKLNLT